MTEGERAVNGGGISAAQVLMGLVSLTVVAAAEAFDEPALWMLVVACGIMDALLALRVVQRVRRSPSSHSPTAWLSPALLGVVAGGLLTWGGLQLTTPPSCPAMPADSGGGLARFLQPVVPPNAPDTDLTFCAVDVNGGAAVGEEYSMEGTVLGGVPDGYRLVLVTQSDPNTCNTLGEPAEGGYQLQDPDEPAPIYRFDPATGRWRFNGELAYAEQSTVRFRYYLVVATEEALQAFRDHRRDNERPDGYAGIDALPPSADPLVRFELQRDPTPACT